MKYSLYEHAVFYALLLIVVIASVVICILGGIYGL